MNVEELVDALAHTLAELMDETLKDTLTNRKAEVLVNAQELKWRLKQ